MEPRIKLYDRAAWKRLRLEQLRREPFCVFCARSGRQVPATVCDHIKPHRGDESLFFDPQNLQSTCVKCHDGIKQQAEKRNFAPGSLRGGDTNGIPFDPSHHWNQAK